jgi:hypothetical protein
MSRRRVSFGEGEERSMSVFSTARAIANLAVVMAALTLTSGCPASGDRGRAISEEPKTDGKEAMNDLKEYASRGREYRIFVGTPVEEPTAWSIADKVEGDDIILDKGMKVALKAVTSFIVAYRNGEILASAGVFEPLPEGVHFIGRSEDEETHTLNSAVLVSGARYVKVSHGVARMVSGRLTYSTRLTNVAKQRVRVLRFGAYTQAGAEWRLNTVSRRFFDAEQFRAWYGLGEREWIEPGESVEDPDNYGGGQVIWAYFCETDTGEKFVTGARLATPAP